MKKIFKYFLLFSPQIAKPNTYIFFFSYSSSYHSHAHRHVHTHISTFTGRIRKAREKPKKKKKGGGEDRKKREGTSSEVFNCLGKKELKHMRMTV